MKRAGVVVATEQGLLARVERSEACRQCGACQMGRRQELFYPLPEGDYQAGDRVVVEVPDESSLPATLFGYGIPLAGLLIGLGVGVACALPEIFQALLALAGGAAGYLTLRRLDGRFRASGRFCTRVDRVDLPKP